MGTEPSLLEASERPPRAWDIDEEESSSSSSNEPEKHEEEQKTVEVPAGVTVTTNEEYMAGTRVLIFLCRPPQLSE